jgi:transposase
MGGRQHVRSDKADKPYVASRYMGGHTTLHPQGYLLEYAPRHPHAYTAGYVFQHRLVMERVLGRFLMEGEVVHHKDEDITNNDPDNLELFSSQSEHMKHHHQDAPMYDPDVIERVRIAAEDPKTPMYALGISPHLVRKICLLNGFQWRSPHVCDLTDDEVREALRGRTTEEAAECLGLSLQTMYNRFDHLLDKRNSPGFLDEHREELCRIATEKGIAAAARKFGTNRTTMYDALRRWGLELQYPRRQELDQRKDEVLRLVQQHGYTGTARILGKSKGAIQFAVKRWSERGDLPDGFALPNTGLKSHKSSPGHKDSGGAPLSQELPLDPPGS